MAKEQRTKKNNLLLAFLKYFGGGFHSVFAFVISLILADKTLSHFKLQKVKVDILAFRFGHPRYWG